jgi:hypothetical protein
MEQQGACVITTELALCWAQLPQGNESKKEIALAIRGTDFRNKDLGDFFADLQIALGKVPYQLRAAKRAFSTEETYAIDRDYDLFLTGHSLGGGIASLVAAKQPSKPPVVTFNSPGMRISFVKSHILDAVGRYTYQNYCDISKFLHIRAHGDLVSRGSGPHMGKVEFVYVDEWGDEKVLGASRHLAQHSIDNMVKCLRPKTWYHKDLKFNQTSITPKMMAG